MKKVLKGKRSIILVFLSSFLLLAGLAYFAFEDGSIRQLSSQDLSRMQYVLVNEDQGIEFEGQRYTLGADFVTLINQDFENRWETTSRSVATAGIKSGQFDAEIVIPRNFSERLLSLQSIDPEQAMIEYQVREGQNEISNQVIQGKIRDILQDFNRRIIQMYFSSIIGTLSEAQQNIKKIVGLETAHKNMLEEKIRVPFQLLPVRQIDVLNKISILEKGNHFFQEEQKNFVQLVNELMADNRSRLESGQKLTEAVQIQGDKYTEEANKKLNHSIQQTEQQLLKQKEQLEEQQAAHLIAYRTQYKQLNQSTQEQFRRFFQPNEKTDTGIFAEFLVASQLFKETQTERIDELKQKISELEEQAVQLKKMREQIAFIYFGDNGRTPETTTEQQIKEAISKLTSENHASESRLHQSYRTQIEKNLSLIDSESLEKLQAKLFEQHLISERQAKNIQDALAIVRKYAEDFNGNLGTSVDFAYLKPEEKHAGEQRIPNRTTLTIDPSKPNTFTLHSEDGVIRHRLNEEEQQRIIEELNSQLALYDHVLYITEIEENKFTIEPNEISQKRVLDFEMKEETENKEDTKQRRLPQRISFTIDTELMWQLTEEQQEATYISTNYFWINSVFGVQSEYTFSAYLPLDQPLKDDLPELMNQLQRLESTAQQIALVFGDPEQTISVSAYASMVQQLENQGKTLEETAASSSIYKMYANLTKDQQLELITDQIYEQYKATGTKLYIEAEEQLERLTLAIGKPDDQSQTGSTLYSILNLMMTPDYLLDIAQGFGNWYEQANQQIDKIYHAWTEVGAVEAESVINHENPYPEINDTVTLDAEIQRLTNQMQDLWRNAHNIAKMISQTAAETTDITRSIEELQQSTIETQENTQKILGSLEDSYTDLSKVNEENVIYSENFDQVLANTRNGGAENRDVFNFLSNPIQVQGQSETIRQDSLIPYSTTVIGLLLAASAAFVIPEFTRRRQQKEDDLLIKMTLCWVNLPNVFLIILFSMVLSGLFSAITTFYAQNQANADLGWSLYAFFVFLTGILLLIGGVRYCKKVTVYFWGAMTGIFFLMSPFLGVVVRENTFAHFLYQLSPLQNIQNGFAVLVNGGNIGWLSYTILFLWLSIGIFLNFMANTEFMCAERKERRLQK